jgi:3-oxoadipate enol-lactonase
MPAVDVYFEQAGQGKPLLLLNGVMMTTQSWVFQSRALSPHFTCVLHDFRGQLRTPHPGPIDMRDHVKDLAALMDRLGIESAHLVGTSYGGEVAMLFALAHPHRVRSLSLIACVSHVEPPLREAVELWRDVALRAPESLYEVTAPYNFSPAVLTPTFLEQGRTRLGAYPSQFFRDFAALCDAFLALDVTHRLPAITARTLVICGENDVLKPRHYSEIIAAGIPGAKLEVVPGAPHAVVIENHEAVNTLLREFLC